MRNVFNQIVIVSSIMIISLLTGCGNSSTSDSATSTFKPGELRLSKMDGMGKSTAPSDNKTLSPSSTTTTTFDLGTIKASQDFYFLLSNSGDFPVTNITIATSNENFMVSPSTIDEISPQSEGFIIPIIKVSVTHGVALNGVGYTDSLLSMGSNTCFLTITGTTTDKHDNVIELAYEIQLNVYAEIMDVDAYDDIAILDLSSPIGYATNALWNYVPAYKCFTPILKNTGNVSIDVTNYNNSWTANYPILEQFTLAPNETKTLNFPSNTDWGGNKSITIKLDGNNTITNYNKLRLEIDGTVLVRFQNF